MAPGGNVLTVNATTGTSSRSPLWSGRSPPVTLLPPGRATCSGWRSSHQRAVYFVNDGNNTLNLFH